MTQKQLEKLGRWWQERLGLLDWDITFEFIRQNSIPDAYGHNRWGYSTHKSKISIERRDFVIDCRTFVSLEHTLVHELLHLVFSASIIVSGGITGSNTEQITIERPIDQLAKVLVELKGEPKLHAKK